MAHVEQREFCSKMKEQYPEYFVGKKVLDIGSLDINGNNRFLFTDCNYIGLDVGEGPNVDVVSVGHLYDGPDEYFDTIISTEVFEHDMFYEKTIQNIIRMLKPGGAFIFTCASTGRPEHGTRRCGEHCAPLLIQISEQWADYYKNLVDSDFLLIDGFKDAFPDGFFIYNGESEIPGDIYFFGVKGGIQKTRKFLPIKVDPQIHNGEYRPEEYKDDIFVIGAWPDTEEKETDLINCITRLRQFYGIPILLVSHYAIKPEIQKLVDYYIFDKDNDILKNEEFAEHDVASGRWTQMNDHRVENQMEFHHDYAIWVSMKHAFNFCKYLGKSQVHYLEYDNIIDIFQYRQSFLERSKNVDAVLYEYNENSIKDLHFAPFCATFIFSAKTDVLIKMMSEVNSKKEYFMNRPKGWQLERLFLHYLQTHTNNYVISPYIANGNELNTKAVWNRDGIFREGAAFQIYPCVDLNDQLYIHLISGFHETDETDDLLLELRYGDNFKFEKLKSKEYKTIHLGEYRKGMTVRVHLFGKEVFTHFLVDNVEKFRTMNKVLWNDERKIVKENPMKNDVNINFVDGGFIEILGIHKEKYLVKFIDKKTTEVVFQTNLQNNQWAKVDRKWFTDWKIELHREGGTPIFYDYDAKDKRVFVVFESSSLGDTIAWLPYVEEFRKKHNCKMIVSTFLNDLFKNQYPDIEFVKPGATVHNLYALYRLGIFIENEQFEPSKHKTDYKKLRLQQIATDILGLEFEEIRPMISKPKPMKSKKPYICIANHSTAQSKYWNNSTGWQELVDYVKELGYDVYLLSKEEDGYMGNKNPNGVIKVDGKSLEEISSILLGSKGFVGISSGLSWLAWSLGVPTTLISGCTEEIHEPSQNVQRIINTNVCNSCFSNHTFDKGDWNWCPLHKGTERQFECSKKILFNDVKPKLEEMLKS